MHGQTKVPCRVGITLLAKQSVFVQRVAVLWRGLEQSCLELRAEGWRQKEVQEAKERNEGKGHHSGLWWNDPRWLLSGLKQFSVSNLFEFLLDSNGLACSNFTTLTQSYLQDSGYGLRGRISWEQSKTSFCPGKARAWWRSWSKRTFARRMRISLVFFLIYVIYVIYLIYLIYPIYLSFLSYLIYLIYLST